jgi:hypothetical protein
MVIYIGSFIISVSWFPHVPDNLWVSFTDFLHYLYAKVKGAYQFFP